jgi:hypothetical protein
MWLAGDQKLLRAYTKMLSRCGFSDIDIFLPGTGNGNIVRGVCLGSLHKNIRSTFYCNDRSLHEANGFVFGHYKTI